MRQGGGSQWILKSFWAVIVIWKFYHNNNFKKLVKYLKRERSYSLPKLIEGKMGNKNIKNVESITKHLPPKKNGSQKKVLKNTEGNSNKYMRTGKNTGTYYFLTKKEINILSCLKINLSFSIPLLIFVSVLKGGISSFLVFSWWLNFFF